MDQKTLRLIAAGGLTLAAGAGIYAMTRHKKAPEKTEDKTAQVTKSERKARPKPTVIPTPDLKTALRPIDKDIFAYIDGIEKGTATGNADAFPQIPHQVSIITDRDGKVPRMVRIDFYRDKVVDERWNIDKDKVTRDVLLTRGLYQDRFVLEGDHWKLQGGLGATLLVGLGPTKLPPAETEPLRPMDKEILDLAKKADAAGGHHIQSDVNPKAPYKVSFVRKDGRVQRAQVDVNRDNRFDETWNLKDPNGVQRLINNPDGPGFSKSYVLKDGKWVRRY
jgi:hypothetical protein